MTARRQPQRKRTARERLLEGVLQLGASAHSCSIRHPLARMHREWARRMLREHERELALRAAAIGANAGPAGAHRAVYDAIRAAILGPRKKGAR